MERSRTERNVLGALAGGMLGIFAFGYFSSGFLLVVGVFTGVIGGWWYQEIWQHTRDGFNGGVAAVRRFFGFVFMPVHKLRTWRADMWRNIDDYEFLYFLGLLVIPIIWLLRRPAAFVAWTQKHPVNRAYLVRVTVLLVFYVINSAVFGMLTLWLIQAAHGIDVDRSLIGLPIVLAGLFLLVMGIVPLGLGPVLLWARDAKESDEPRRAFYNTWIRYDSLGPIRFWVEELVFVTKAWFSVVAFLAASIVWFSGTGPVFLAVIGLLSGLIGLVKGVYQVSLRTDHWLCFGATLTVTALSAWTLGAYFADARVVWLTALLTGAASAFATEGLQRLLASFFQRERSARAVALVPLGRQLRPSGNWFWKLSCAVEHWFTQFLPAAVGY